MSGTREDGYYIDPVRFTELLIGYQETDCQVTLDALIRECFYPLAIGVLRKFPMRFVDADDVVQECVLQCVKQIGEFDLNFETRNPNSTGEKFRKAFSFFTTCASNTLKGQYRKEKSLNERKKNYFLHLTDKEHRLSRGVRTVRAEVLASQEAE